MKWLALILSLICGTSLAHQQSASYSNWNLAGEQLRASLRYSSVDLSRVGLHPGQTDYSEATIAFLRERVRVHGPDGACDGATGDHAHVGEGWVTVRLAWVCPAQGRLDIEIDALFDRSGNHVHLARLRTADGTPRTRALNASVRSWTVRGEDTYARNLPGYLWLGLAHIATGWDHLAFVLVLLIAARRARELIWLITGFTVAHSLTLGAAVLGYVSSESRSVELVIALSILLLAVENAWRAESCRGAWPLGIVAVLLAGGVASQALGPATLLGLGLFCVCYGLLLRAHIAPARLRFSVTFAFGLVHGLGFAGLLSSLRIEAEGLPLALLGFNLGVEIGQLLFVALVWPLLIGLRGRMPLTPAVVNAMMAALATFWLVTRAV